jgi:hypothetical protein
VMVASRPKVSFWPDGSINPRNYGWLFLECCINYWLHFVYSNKHIFIYTYQ